MQGWLSRALLKRSLRCLISLIVGAVMLQDLYAVQAQSSAGLTWDFEGGDLKSWTTTGQVQAITDSIDPLTDQLMRTVAQGQHSAQIGDATPWGVQGDQSSSISQVITVPQADGKPVLQFSYAVVANDPPGHAEVDKPYFELVLQDMTTGERLSVSDFKYTSQTSQEWFLGQPPDAQGVSQRGFSQVSGDRWVFIPWRNETIDLSDRIGHQLLLQFVVRDCNPTAHAAYGYLDNIHIGQQRALAPLPSLASQPRPAGVPLAPNLVQTASTRVEQLGLWPWCLLLPLLALLGALAFFLRPRRVTPDAGQFPIRDSQRRPEQQRSSRPGASRTGSNQRGEPAVIPDENGGVSRRE